LRVLRRDLRIVQVGDALLKPKLRLLTGFGEGSLLTQVFNSVLRSEAKESHVLNRNDYVEPPWFVRLLPKRCTDLCRRSPSRCTLAVYQFYEVSFYVPAGWRSAAMNRNQARRGGVPQRLLGRGRQRIAVR
jgi:hypothetical protein